MASQPDSTAGLEEVVHANYVLWAAGVHSWIRNQLGFHLEGDSTDYIWASLISYPLPISQKLEYATQLTQ